MTKRTLSFLLGLLVLMFLFFVFAVIIIGVIMFRGELPTIGGDTVALVRVEGIIMDTNDEIRLLRRYAESSMVRAIVVRIESPGGVVGASQELHREIMKARNTARKPIVASMGNVAASGGYYVAAAAEEIVANPGTVTGSIGVLFQSYDLQGISKKIGFDVNTIKSGRFKDTGSAFRDMTPEEKEIVQKTIDDTYDQFLEAVLEGRRLKLAQAYLKQSSTATEAARLKTKTTDSQTSQTGPTGQTGQTSPTLLSDLAQLSRAVEPAVVKEYLRSLADGRVLSGNQAYQAGLVDHLGGLQDAIALAAQKAGIRGKPRVLQEKRRITLWDLLQSRTNILPEFVRRHGVSLEYRLSFD